MSEHQVFNVYDGGTLNYTSSSNSNGLEDISKKSSKFGKFPFKTILAGVGLSYIIGVSQTPKQDFDFFNNVGVGFKTAYELVTPGLEKTYGALETKFFESVDEYGPKFIEVSSDAIDSTSDSIKKWYLEQSI